MEENQSKRFNRWIEAKHELAMVCRNPMLLATILLVSALLIVFVIYPIFQVIRVSLKPDGEFSLDTYRYLLSQWWLRQTFVNSVVLGVIVATL
jgi:iron(III) transport system permease protein